MCPEIVSRFMSENYRKFPRDKIAPIVEILYSVPDDKETMLFNSQYKNPTISLVLSLTMGYLGIDRFYVGDVWIGLFKLLTLGCGGIFTIFDWFFIGKRTRAKNYLKLLQLCK